MERLHYAYLNNDGDLIVQLTGGGARAVLRPGAKAEDVILELRTLADRLHAGLDARAPTPQPKP